MRDNNIKGIGYERFKGVLVMRDNNIKGIGYERFKGVLVMRDKGVSDERQVIR
ncbi:hypothetical protein CWI37_0910p0040 [Hamiltosporidium tvaerminnensis]|uniref:Uncharacterized protein n=1 Tax=Hamiltosporidium tvaerminnensis TaxID=1176355 RepID=A0A4Q9L0B9_9MICR|nr:hypothetical protein CWI37_0910p0040 [Hamiltosporidium tvaerminnensis]